MKNIILGSILMLVFLPQLSFGQTQPANSVPADSNTAPADTTPATEVSTPSPAAVTPGLPNPKMDYCTHLADSKAINFFQNQGQERGTFMQAHMDIVHKQDSLGRWLMDHKNDPTMASQRPQGPTAQDQSVMAVFIQHQLSDKNAFLSKLNADKQTCLNS